jgi:hypothetical protein
MPTPIADEAVKEIMYIPQQIFLGTASDMADIAAALHKVERHYASRRMSTALREYAAESPPGESIACYYPGT